MSKKVKIFDPPKDGPKVLVFDIETAPMSAYIWSLWDKEVQLNHVINDWFILSWSAKWLNSPEDEIMYMDQRDAKNVEDDYDLLKQIWMLLDKADVVVTQNGKRFDQRKLNARFIINGFQPPSSFKHIDTKEIAKRHFDFTSNRLEYLSNTLCESYKKLKPKKFQGFEMWRECMKGNVEAFKEMEEYNKHDVLALEELYKKLAPWAPTINWSLFNSNHDHVCSCGSTDLRKNGFYYTKVGKYQKFKCKKCGAEFRSKTNLIAPEIRKELKVPIKD